MKKNILKATGKNIVENFSDNNFAIVLTILREYLNPEDTLNALRKVYSDYNLTQEGYYGNTRYVGFNIEGGDWLNHPQLIFNTDTETFHVVRDIENFINNNF